MKRSRLLSIVCIACIVGCTSDTPSTATDSGASETTAGNGPRQDAAPDTSHTGGASGTLSDAATSMHAGRGAPPPDAGQSKDASATQDGSSATHDAGFTHDAAGAMPMGRSAGCNQPAPSEDTAEHFIPHDVVVDGVDPVFIAEHPANGGSWTQRSYYVRLPDNYDAAKAYPLSIGGSGCGNTDGTSGSGGGLTTLPQGQDVAIQVGLNYVYPENAGACFADDYTNTPDLPYFDAVLAQLEADYCIDRDKVFVSGFSSGAWETYLLGCARAGIVRGIGTAAGGLRMTRPPCTQAPVAAILVAGLNDTENPIGPLAPPGKNDSLGSAPARDDILARNGCVGTDTEAWDAAYPACVKYSGCPEAYPVVWCAIDAGHGDGGDISSSGFWKLWSSLPTP